MINLKNMSGVYEIRNTVNGTRYVGSTINLLRRFGQHKSDLRGGIHPNRNLTSDWLVRGESVFEFSALAILEHKDLLSTEQKVFDALVRDGASVYNHFAHVVSPTVGTHLSKEHKEKLSKALKGRCNSPETRRKISAGRLGKKYPRKQLTGEI